MENNRLPALRKKVAKGCMSLDTVDGRNPAPVDMVNIPLFAGFHTC